MKSFLTLMLVLTGFAAAAQNPGPLFIKNTSMVNDVTTDKVFVMDDPVLELTLKEADQGDYFIAIHTMKEFKVVDGKANLEEIWVVENDDATLKPMRFKNSTEFLNFMHEHGYDMVHKHKMKNRTEYTFKKK